MKTKLPPSDYSFDEENLIRLSKELDKEAAIRIATKMSKAIEKALNDNRTKTNH